MKEIPRFTTALRQFGSVSKKPPGQTADTSSSPLHSFGNLRSVLDRKRRERADKERVEKLSWDDLSVVVKNAPGSSGDGEKIIKELIVIAMSIVGDDKDTETVRACAAFLIETLMTTDYVTASQTQALVAVFGPVSATDVSTALTLTHRLLNVVSMEAMERIMPKSRPIQRMFGHNIAFKPSERRTLAKSLHLYAKKPTTENTATLDMTYKVSLVHTEEAPSVPGSGPKRDGRWLKDEVDKRLSHTSEDGRKGIMRTVFELLSSTSADNDLQNELFELLGFDQFEFIQTLITERSVVVQDLLDSASLFAYASQPLSQREKNRGHPGHGNQVIVESTSEKALQKMIRKDEKRLQRLRDRGPAPTADDVVLDISQLKARREEALRTSLQSSVLPISSMGAGEERYPFVFDSMLEAQKSSAFIAGAKLELPQGFEKTTNHTYEEVTIPPSPPISVNLRAGEKLVSVSSLDEISQVAFRGMKSLNRIQSIVFPSAYDTNENLLICAPTGAGKTNIAMLTILREVKQNIVEGVIRKDQFKIIYVAPMKALAAEMVQNFGRRLEPLGIAVRELTGDMQLTKQEILNTQMIITTPEKWDVVTRKSTGDVGFTQLVKLLIIDEVHLLHEDRGSVIETLIARTLRQVETSQKMIRVVGLSATLPNYTDVARFLNVNPYYGLFYFDGRFRPVPLGQTFIGVKTLSRAQQIADMNEVCYEKVVEQARADEQVMVFVHARNETVRTATRLRDLAREHGTIRMFEAKGDKDFGEGDALSKMSKARYKPLRDLYPDGFAVHHAGMPRSDRNMVEKYFGKGFIRCLVCTATLAWGVNLPAHAVIIKGTQLYNAKLGAYVDLGILDVLQIFGRAGRPQFDKYGHGTIITTFDKLSHYLSLITRQNPIESQFLQSIIDNLNAEVSLKTVTTIEDAVTWLSYTYLHVRMRRNPLVYGVTHKQLQEDLNLSEHRRALIVNAARALDKARMIRFNESTGTLDSTDLGRIASHYYVKFATVEVINEFLQPYMDEAGLIGLVAKSQEFDNVKVRDEEMGELDNLKNDACPFVVAGGSENTYGKVNILLQTFVSRQELDSFSLATDMAYVAQNGARIVRALFEIVLKKGWPVMATRLLTLSKIIEKQLWEFQNPLHQFKDLSNEIMWKLEGNHMTIERLKEMDSAEIGIMIRHPRMGAHVKRLAHALPDLSIEVTLQPITRTILRVKLTVTPEFTWVDKYHGKGAEGFWVWIEDPDNNHIYHSEYVMLTKKQVTTRDRSGGTTEPIHLVFTIPIFEPLPTQYYVKALSDRWLGAQVVEPVSFKHLLLPQRHPPHTELLDLRPLPISVYDDAALESLYTYSHFNPIQTQIFHTLYHSDCNVLLGAPTGSGKTVAAEMAIFRLFREYPNEKAVYIAPLKALVRERMTDWKIRIEKKLGKKVVELTGDVTPDMRAVAAADLIVTTPEKWDGVSRSWQNRSYVQSVTLLVIDEIHLLGADRGPVLEVVVSRTNFISANTNRRVRVVGLSTALANAQDLADWLSIKEMGLFNFRPSVRPVPLEVHIHGFPGKHYCPRMATMNKPAYQAIKAHSPEKPTMIFVSSRRQTRLTGLDLISLLAAADSPKDWLHMDEGEMEVIIRGVKDTNLKLMLAFGVGIHHAGLHEKDRKVVEELFVNGKIQVLIATSTLAWGVNFPAHLVIVKGTEYFDGKVKKYVDFPITDVLQMMGRAGRPQFDDSGVAVILVHDVKKHFYKKFLYEPFPVESSLPEVLSDHLNAEIVAGTIGTKQEALDYLTWTYFFRRLIMNPSYYGLEDTSPASISSFLSAMVEKSLRELESSHCLSLAEDETTLVSETMGRIASYYYLSHKTMSMFYGQLTASSTLEDLLLILSNVEEFAELPVRHNEDKLNGDLAGQCRFDVNRLTLDSSHTKAHILLQCHFSRSQFPSTDYRTDLKSVLDQALRVLQAMLDVCGDAGWLATSLKVIHLIQMCVQGRWVMDSSLLCLPHVEKYHLEVFRTPQGYPLDSVPELIDYCTDAGVDRKKSNLGSVMHATGLSGDNIQEIQRVLETYPLIELTLAVHEDEPGAKNSGVSLNVHDKKGVPKASDWTVLHADTQYVLTVNVRRINRARGDGKALAPRFPKSKDEGWMMVLGDVEGKELLALKRVAAMRTGRTRVSLSFVTPTKTGRVIYSLSVMSDCYLGLDQQYDLHLDVQQPPPSQQQQQYKQQSAVI